MSLTTCVYRTLLLALVLSALPMNLAGQSWSIDTYVGRSSYNIDPLTLASRTGMLGIRYYRDRRLFQATAGIPLSNQDMTWGALELGDRFSLRRGGLEAGADVSLLAYGNRDPVVRVTGQGLLGEFLPMISHNLGAGVLELRSGPRWYGTRQGDNDWTRMLWTTQVRGSVEPTARLQLASDFRHDRGGQGEKYNRAGLSIGGIVGRVAVRASAGHWFDSPGNGRPEWGLSIAIPVKRVWFVSSAGYQDFDPTFLSAPRTSWSVGLSIPFGGKRETTSESVANGDSTRVVLRLPLREAGAAPSVAGDFNSWMPVRMTRCDHEWCFPVNLAAGVYHYAFRSNDGKWFVPPGTPNRAEDGMGGWQAVLVVQ